MVEFGLKLEDNKVSEWSDKYIDYDALKKILKKASAAVKKRDDLCKRKPELAEEIVIAYKQGNGPNQMTPSPSHDGLNLLDISNNNIVGLPVEEEDDRVVDQVPNTSGESQPLMKRQYESHGTMTSEKQTDSISGHISRTLSGYALGGYFSNSKYEQRIRESLEEIENIESKFDESIHEQVRQMNVTYCASECDNESALTSHTFNSYTR